MNTNPLPVRSRAGSTGGLQPTAGFRALLAGLSHTTTSGRCRLVFALLPALTVPAFGAVESATSSGYALSAKISLAGLPVVDTKINELTRTAPPAYAPPASGINLNLNTIVLVATGVTTSNVSSNVDGLAGSRTTTAASRIDGLNLALADTILTSPLVALGGTGSIIGSQCQVQGNGVTSQVTGAATLTNVSLSVLGIPVNLPLNPAPNSVVNAAGGVVGLTIYLNEQTPVTGTNGQEILCTALRIKLDAVNVVGVGLLSGEIKAGVSTARHDQDTDNDGVPDSADGDADGDGITNAVEIAQAPSSGDTDGDALPNYLDLDSDNDGVNDVIEGGGSDADRNGIQDGTADADSDGIVDTVDTTRGGTALAVPDTDGDGLRDYLDLDSDNDAISDLVEGGSAGADINADGVADGTDDDQDGIISRVDGSPSYGDAPPSGISPPDTDGDGIPNYRDPSSNGPGSRDIVKAGKGSTDQNGDGRIDNITDADKDGIADVVDSKPGVFGGLGDSDGDGVSDVDEGGGQRDTDGDGKPDSEDQDSDADGIPDATEQTNAGPGFDSDGDGIVDRLDLDSDNDGLNDVIEGGGADADGNGRQDGTADADFDGLVDTVDPDRGGTALPVPDTDGDGAEDYIDLDSDNDTVADLIEGGSGGPDTNRDGMVDGADSDGDGIRDAVDLLAGFGDANDTGARNTDGTDKPDYIDPDSDNAGGNDIENAGHKDLDDDGDGDIDSPIVDPDRDGVDVQVDTKPNEFGGTGGCVSTGAEWRTENFTAAELANPAISGWDADPDHDGVSNGLEYVLGTNPRENSPLPDLITGFNDSSGFSIKLDRDSCVRAFVAVEYSTDLQVWTSTGPGIEYVTDSPSQLIANVKGSISGTNEDSQQRLFIRLRVTVP